MASETVVHKWNHLQKKIKSLNRTKCSSTKKNREIAILIKYLNEKLLVLKAILQRRSDIYKCICCIICNKKKEEDQDYLTSCKGDEKGGKKTEDSTINQA